MTKRVCVEDEKPTLAEQGSILSSMRAEWAAQRVEFQAWDEAQREHIATQMRAIPAELQVLTLSCKAEEGEVVAGTILPTPEPMDTTENASPSQVSILEANGETHETNPSNAHAASSDSPLRSLSCIHRRTALLPTWPWML